MVWFCGELAVAALPKGMIEDAHGALCQTHLDVTNRLMTDLPTVSGESMHAFSDPELEAAHMINSVKAMDVLHASGLTRARAGEAIKVISTLSAELGRRHGPTWGHPSFSRLVLAPLIKGRGSPGSSALAAHGLPAEAPHAGRQNYRLCRKPRQFGQRRHIAG